MTTRMGFEQELQLLKKSLEEMGRSVEYSIDRLFEAIEKGDEDIAETIVKSDRNVNDMEKSIESQCLSLITKQQPIASDLRLVSAALKVVTDLERIADHAVDIAELILRWKKVQFLDYSTHVGPMTVAAKEMVHKAVEVFICQDVEGAREVIESDDIVDDLFNKAKSDVIRLLKEGNDDTDIVVDVLMIAKYLEKMGDHAVNIAEWEIFRETGIVDNVRIF